MTERRGLGATTRSWGLEKGEQRFGSLLVNLVCFAAVSCACYGSVLFQDGQFAFRDAGHYYYPLHRRVQQEWEAGRLPLWEPEENSGSPLLGNPTAAVLYPGKLIFALFSYPWAARFYVVAHTALAYGAMRALARSWQLSRTGSAISAMSYAFGAPILFQYCNIIYLVGASWAPLGFRAADRWLRSGRRSGLVALALVLAMQTLGGDPEAAYLVVLCAFGYALGLALTGAAAPRAFRFALLVGAVLVGWGLTTLLPHMPVGVGQLVLVLAWVGLGSVVLATQSRGDRKEGRRLGVMLVGLAGSCALALTLTAVQLGPVLENILASVRIEDPNQQDMYGFSVEPYRAVEWIWPNVFGTFTAGNRYWLMTLPPAGMHRSWSLSLYLGALPFVLALTAAGFRSGPPWHAWLTAVAIISAIAGVGKFATPSGWRGETRTESERAAPGDPSTPQEEDRGGVYGVLTRTLPGFRFFRYPGKLLTFTCLALTCLAGVGWDRVAEGRGRPAVIIAAGLVALTTAVLAGTGLWSSAITSALSAANAQGDVVFGPLDVRGALADMLRGLTHGLVALTFALAVLVTARKRPRLAAALALLVLAVDLAIANRGLIVTVPQAVFEQAPETLEAISRAEAVEPSDGPFRVHRMRAWTPTGWSLASSSERLHELPSWEFDTLLPRFGMPLGLNYTFTEESSTEAAAYGRFFQPIPRMVDERSAPMLMMEPRQHVLYYPRRGFDLWNTGYFILPANPGGWTAANRSYAAFLDNTEMIYPDSAALERSEEGSSRERWLMTKDVQVRRNQAVFPRAWVVHSARMVRPLGDSNDRTRAAFLRSLLFQNDRIWSDPDRLVLDLRTTAIVETERPDLLAPLLPMRAPGSPETVRISRYDPQRVELSVVLSGPGIVILADTNRPGWRLSIDGVPTKILNVNLMMRGAGVTTGEHTLVYTYEPTTLRVGACVSLAGSAALAALCLWCRFDPAKASA
jgi:hypothetical protein